ncbi:saccharopine dehydrogenase family protein [soil metagenome]
MKLAVLGAGMVGSAIAIDLCKNFEVTSVDRSSESLDQVKRKEPSIKILQYDLSNYNGYKDLLTEFDLVVTAVPGFMGYKTLEAVINAGKDVVDISFFPEDALTLDKQAKKNNVTAIVDCGVAPGMSNFVLGYYNQRMKIERFNCMVGGLPKRRIKPFEYKAPFSPVDVIEEYTRPARFIEDGKLITKEALTDPELIDFEKPGTLESFNTDGLRSLLFTMGHIPNMKEKTLRYPGHIGLISSLIKAGFFDENPITINGVEISPLAFSSKILIDQWKLSKNEVEFTVMRIKLEGIKNNKPYQVTYHLYDEYDAATETSSMARTTGYTCNAAVNLIAKKLFKEKGVFPPELVGHNEACFNFVLQYLHDRGVIYTKTESL